MVERTIVVQGPFEVVEEKEKNCKTRVDMRTRRTRSDQIRSKLAIVQNNSK